VTSALRILLLEDDAHDAELIEEFLHANHVACDVIHVQTRAEFVAGLEDAGINLILADYRLPSFDGLSALRLAVDTRPDLPFIFVSGALGEEVAIEAIKIGATDYVVKSRLSRLVPSVQRALREAGERAERKRAEEALRRSEMYLAEGQRISHTGSWSWNLASGTLVWSEEHRRIFGVDLAQTELTFQLFHSTVHPEDRSLVQQVLDRAIRERSRFSLDYRIILPDGAVRYLHGTGRPVLTAAGDLDDYIGTTMDITERKRSEELLRNAQADLARVARLTTISELAASIAHEINQPLGAMVVSGNACLRWLAPDQLQLDEARRAAERIVRDGHRAGDILRSVRALAGKSAPDITELDINDAIREVLALMRGELDKHDVSLEIELSEALAPVMGDRVQLEQVILNLVMNAIEAMSTDTSAPRLLCIRSHGEATGAALIRVEDSGPGIAPETMDRLFEAFFTTKPSGMGMGLSICRSIINAHGGRLWASPGSPRGAVLQFTVPIAAKSGALAAHGASRAAGTRSHRP
jgi:PAS domain S-box-containing protein